jgi:hypothetical protein
MNEYQIFIDNLKALQIQGYPTQHIIDTWRLGKDDILILLDQNLVINILLGDKIMISNIKRKINKINTLNKIIQQGLLEDDTSN